MKPGTTIARVRDFAKRITGALALVIRKAYNFRVAVFNTSPIVSGQNAAPSTLVVGTARYALSCSHTQLLQMYKSLDGVTWTLMDAAHSPGGDGTGFSNIVLVGAVLWVVAYANEAVSSAFVQFTPYNTVTDTWGVTTITTAASISGAEFSGMAYDLVDNALVCVAAQPNLVTGNEDGAYLVFNIGTLTEGGWQVAIASTLTTSLVGWGVIRGVGRTHLFYMELDSATSLNANVYQIALHDGGGVGAKQNIATAAIGIAVYTAQTDGSSMFLGVSNTDASPTQNVVLEAPLAATDAPVWTSTALTGTDGSPLAYFAFDRTAHVAYYITSFTNGAGESVLQYTANPGTGWSPQQTIFADADTSDSWGLTLQAFGVVVTSGTIEGALFGSLGAFDGGFYFTYMIVPVGPPNPPIQPTMQILPFPTSDPCCMCPPLVTCAQCGGDGKMYATSKTVVAPKE